MQESGRPPGTPATPLRPRSVPWSHAAAWYEEAMRLFKFAPFSFVGLAIVIIVTDFALETLPGILAFAGQIITPLVTCALLYASAAVDRRVAPSPRMLLLVFQAGGNAIA